MSKVSHTTIKGGTYFVSLSGTKWNGMERVRCACLLCSRPLAGDRACEGGGGGAGGGVDL